MSMERLDIAHSSHRRQLSPLPMGGSSPSGEGLGANSYYLERDGRPWFAVSGEFHYSRCDERDWRDELLKMKACGLGIVSTYVFWIHHEQERGRFDWTGRRDLRRFIETCGELGLWAVVRLGPWCHGEVRNGGFPDWLYAQSFDLRSNDPEYLALVATLYGQIGEQLRGLYFKDGGPVIGAQLENEYMHAGAPWEMTTGTSDEWIGSGRDGETHLLELKRFAREAGIDVPFYTCTGWGGAAAPVPELLPLWGGYSFQPWLFYGDIEEHPATPEYIFRDYHNDSIPSTYNFSPRYAPESLPYACCEMGGGMTVFYRYRFRLPPEAVEAMAVVKAASGCNFLGYYMFKGGTNPVGRNGAFLNEHQVPKLSYDYQAAIGECGALRGQAHSLRLLHYLFRGFEERFCPTTTVLPEGAELIDPLDQGSLRFAARASGRSGFLFVCNYQDHAETRGKEGIAFELSLPSSDADLGATEKLRIPLEGATSLAADASCVLPFHFDLGGVDLLYATAQLITRISIQGEEVYFFFAPAGMAAEFAFDEACVASIEPFFGASVASRCALCDTESRRRAFVARAAREGASWLRVVGRDGSSRRVCCLSREEALRFWVVNLDGADYALLSEAVPLAIGSGPVDGTGLKGGRELRLECAGSGPFALASFPALPGLSALGDARIAGLGEERGFARYAIDLPKAELSFEAEYRGQRRARLNFGQLPACKRAILSVEYEGDIGNAYVDDLLVADNFWNGESWTIDLMRLRRDPFSSGLTLDVRPNRAGSRVLSDTAMAGRSESAQAETGRIVGLRTTLVRDAVLRIGGRG